jgi:hypothetical protein
MVLSAIDGVGSLLTLAGDRCNRDFGSAGIVQRKMSSTGGQARGEDHSHVRVALRRKLSVATGLNIAKRFLATQ